MNSAGSGQPNDAVAISGQEQTGSQALSEVLTKWLALMNMDDDATRWGDHAAPDAPWWYNEAASVSQFAGAIWQVGGNAFADFHVVRRRDDGGAALGRADLSFSLGKWEAIVEAKQVWPLLRDPADAWFKAELNAARRQARNLTTHGARLAALFISPRTEDVELLRDQKRFLEGVNVLLGRARELGATAMAWSFPKHTRELRSRRTGYTSLYYPGAIVAIFPAELP